VEKVEELAHGTIFTGETQFGKTRFETFRECFEASNDVFLGVKNCRFSITPSHAILHTDIFPMTQEARQLESVCKIYATQKLTFLFSHL